MADRTETEGIMTEQDNSDKAGSTPIIKTTIRKKPESDAISSDSVRPEGAVKIRVDRLDFWYGASQALYDISLQIPSNEVFALIGPSGCGKSTFLRTLNRMNDTIPGTRLTGSVRLDDIDIYRDIRDVSAIRTRVGMIFQKSNPFPKSIFENVAYGLRVNGIRNQDLIREVVEDTLRKAYLWEEVKDKLENSAMMLSGGQQQRLCIARALAIRPDVILMDEPASALDPISTAKIEDLIGHLKADYTIVIVTHNMQQAARVSDRTAFFFEGRMIEVGPTSVMFTKPSKKKTEDYITGRFG